MADSESEGDEGLVRADLDGGASESAFAGTNVLGEHFYRSHDMLRVTLCGNKIFKTFCFLL